MGDLPWSARGPAVTVAATVGLDQGDLLLPSQMHSELLIWPPSQAKYSEPISMVVIFANRAPAQFAALRGTCQNASQSTSGTDVDDASAELLPRGSVNKLTAHKRGNLNQNRYISTIMGCNVLPFLALLCLVPSRYITAQRKSTDPIIENTRDLLIHGDVYLVGYSGERSEKYNNHWYGCIFSRPLTTEGLKVSVDLHYVEYKSKSQRGRVQPQ
ncbi:hypothetical protein MRX96_044735 [Rhipicephalus microplus]